VLAGAWELLEAGRTGPASAAEAFAALSQWIPALAGLSHAELGLSGRQLETVGVTR